MRYRISNVSKRNGVVNINSGIVGRVVDFDLDKARRQMGSDNPVLIDFVTDRNGIPYHSPKQIVTMKLNSVTSINWFCEKKVVVIEDGDTVYTFDREK